MTPRAWSDALAGAYTRLVLARPWAVLVLLGALLALLGWQARDFRLDASADSLLLESDADLRTFRQVAQRYTAFDFLVVTYTPPGDLLAEQSLRTVERLGEALAGVDGVKSVLSLLDVPLILNVEGPIAEIVDNTRTLRSDDVDMARAREELTTSPVFRELLISTDGGTTALQVTLQENADFARLRAERDRLVQARHQGGLDAAQANELARITGEYDALKTQLDRRRHTTIAQVRAVLREFDDTGELHLGGIPMIADDMITFIRNDLVVFGSGVFVFLVIMLWTIFRRLRWVLLPLASCLFAGVVMMGLLGWVGWRVTVISSNFISLMLIITMSMNVHLVVRYRQLNRDYPELDQGELVLGTTRRMVWPCLYTALTTIIAFMSLVVSDIKPVIDFGWMMTIGLSVTFLTSFLLFPSLLSTLPRLPAAPGAVYDDKGGWQFTAALARMTERHGNAILVASVVLIAVSVAGVYRLKVENSFIEYFSEDTEIYRGMKLIDDKLGGTTPLDIVVRFSGYDEAQGETAAATVTGGDSSAGPASTGADSLDGGLLDELGDLLGDQSAQDPADYWFTPQKIALIKRVHDFLDAQPEIGKVLSLASIIRVAEQLNDGKPFSGIELALLYKRLPAEIRRQMIEPFVSIEHDEARISLRVLDSLPDLRRKELLERIESGLVNEAGLDPRQVTVTGVLLLYNNMLQSLFESQIETLGVVMLGVTLMLVLLFRSVSLALIGIVPNLLAAALILGLMGLLGIPLDMMTITIAAITIGIAVDNSIHYIYRFREEFPKTGDYVRTLHYCHANIGKAVFYTAITIIVGFSILVLSNFIPTIYFGAFTALAMAIALLAALTLLPRLIMLWRPFRAPVPADTTP